MTIRQSKSSSCNKVSLDLLMRHYYYYYYSFPCTITTTNSDRVNEDDVDDSTSYVLLVCIYCINIHTIRLHIWKLQLFTSKVDWVRFTKPDCNTSTNKWIAAVIPHTTPNWFSFTRLINQNKQQEDQMICHWH